MVNKETIGKPFRRIRIPVEARQRMGEYKGIPVLDTFYTAGLVQEEDGTSQRYLLPTTHREAIVLDGGAMNRYALPAEEPVRVIEILYKNLLLLTGNPEIGSKPEIHIIISSEENDQFVEYGVDPIDFRTGGGILAGLCLLREYGEPSESSLKRHAEEIMESIAKLTRKRSRGA